MESPEMLNSRATSWPDLPGACEKGHTRDVPGGLLPGQGTQVDPWLGKQDLTCPGVTKPLCCKTQLSQDQNTTNKKRQAWGLYWELLP